MGFLSKATIHSNNPDRSKEHIDMHQSKIDTHVNTQPPAKFANDEFVVLIKEFVERNQHQEQQEEKNLAHPFKPIESIYLQQFRYSLVEWT